MRYKVLTSPFVSRIVRVIVRVRVLPPKRFGRSFDESCAAESLSEILLSSSPNTASRAEELSPCEASDDNSGSGDITGCCEEPGSCVLWIGVRVTDWRPSASSSDPLCDMRSASSRVVSLPSHAATLSARNCTTTPSAAYPGAAAVRSSSCGAACKACGACGTALESYGTRSPKIETAVPCFIYRAKCNCIHRVLSSPG